MQELTDGFVAERVVNEWIKFYNTDSPHTVLDKRTPGKAYFDGKKNDESGMITKPDTP